MHAYAGGEASGLCATLLVFVLAVVTFADPRVLGRWECVMKRCTLWLGRRNGVPFWTTVNCMVIMTSFAVIYEVFLV